MPSKHEPFGIVALEALASKSILLSSRIDGLGDFLDDTNSLYCGTTPDTISKALYELTQLTNEKKSELINNGYDTCKKYDWDIVANQYYDVYQNMLNYKK
jgi:glycosyltransferase involved in cell wall biosynthesis